MDLVYGVMNIRRDRFKNLSAQIMPQNTYTDLFRISFLKTNGASTTLASYRDARYILIVNTATLCGLAPQMKDLSMLYESYRDQ